MYSNSIEDLITHLSDVRDALALKMIDLIKDVTYQIECEPHFHSLYNPVYMGALAYGDTPTAVTFEENIGIDYRPLVTAEYTTPVIEAYASIIIDKTELSIIEMDLYDDKVNVTNSYGSPWGEFDNLDHVIDEITQYSLLHPILDYVNEKRGLIDLMQLAISCCNDCKWAVIHYFDIISRGYDEIHNSKKESTQWESNTIEDPNNVKGSNFFTDDE